MSITARQALSRSDANPALAESFGYDSLNRLTSTNVALTPTPLVKSFTYNAIGNIATKSDVGTYTYPSAGQARRHAVTSISGGVINTSFTYDAKGNMTAGNGLTVAYASFSKPSSITRGTNTLLFSHDPEHQRFKQIAPGGTTLYLGSGGAMVEKFTGSDGSVRWTHYLVSAGGLVGMHIENSDETVLTRYFHKDHLGSIAVITSEAGAVLERLSFDAWGKRRYADGSDDPAGAIASQTNRGFTGHEELDAVGLVHMNGRVEACPRVGEAEPGEPAAGALRHARPDDREPVLHPGLEPLFLRRQLTPQLHRPQRLLLPGLLLEADLQSRREFPAPVLGKPPANCGGRGLHPNRGHLIPLPRRIPGAWQQRSLARGARRSEQVTTGMVELLAMLSPDLADGRVLSFPRVLTGGRERLGRRDA